MRQTTVPVSYAKTLIEYIASVGGDTDEVIRSSGLPENLRELPSDSEERVSSRVYNSLYLRYSSMVEGLLFGLPSTVESPTDGFRMMCIYVNQSENLGEAIERFAEFYRMFGDPRWQFSVARDELGIYVEFQGVSPKDDLLERENSGLFTLNIMLISHYLYRWMTGRFVRLDEISLTVDPYSRGEGIYEKYQECFECENILTKQAKNYLRVGRECINYPMVNTGVAIDEFVQDMVYKMLVLPGKAEESLTDRIRGILGNDFSKSVPGLDAIAKTLNTSESTIRRKLKEEGTTYQKIKDDCRRQAAINYLDNDKYTISDVSRLMGFDDLSAFCRAVKRWIGVTPRDYRKGLSDEVQEAS